MPIKRHKSVIKRVNLQTRNKNAIKRRLLEISIRVDGYIYKNKPISVEECEKYLHEISVHRAACNDDTHILQVIEKLSRCMKSIIEETKKKIPYQNFIASENEPNVQLFSQHSSVNSKSDDNIAISENINQKSSTSIVNVISKNKNKENGSKNNTTLAACNEDTSDVSTGRCRDINIMGKNRQFKSLNSKTQQSDNSITEVDVMNEIATQQGLKLNTSKVINIVTEKAKYIKSDHVYYSNIDKQPKVNMDDNSDLTSENKNEKRKTKKRNTKVIDNTQQTHMPCVNRTNTKTKKKKVNSGATQKLMSHNQTLKIDGTMDAHTSQIPNKNNKIRIVKKNVNNSLPRTTKGRKASKKNNIISSNFKEDNNPLPSVIAPLFCATPNIYKKNQIDDNQSDKASVPMITDNNEGRDKVNNHDVIASQMSALRIYNECVLNDLSWVKDIRYVREISTNEIDQTPNRFNENFWNNFSLPTEWNDIDFVD